VSFAAITLYVASQRVFIVIYFNPDTFGYTFVALILWTCTREVPISNLDSYRLFLTVFVVFLSLSRRMLEHTFRKAIVTCLQLLMYSQVVIIFSVSLDAL
jgi:hypothetical protein